MQSWARVTDDNKAHWRNSGHICRHTEDRGQQGLFVCFARKVSHCLSNLCYEHCHYVCGSRCLDKRDEIVLLDKKKELIEKELELEKLKRGIPLEPTRVVEV